MKAAASVLLLALAGCAALARDGDGAAAGRLGALDPSSVPPPAPARVELGRRLFFDAGLSRDGSLSCASCHRPELGLSDGRPTAVGLGGKALKRHTPSLYNLAWVGRYFWDGRAGSLEEQARMVLESPDEMGTTVDGVVEKLGRDASYVAGFEAAYPGSGLKGANVLDAIASFERSLVAAGAPFDRYVGGDASALAPGAVRGLKLFLGKANCVACHAGPAFTDGKFHNTGVSASDPGRIAVVRNIEFSMRPYPFFGHRGAFKTPGLRNVKLSPPYFHDGSAKTLEDVVRFYNQGGRHKDPEAHSPDVRPLGLQEGEIRDLLDFLDSLTSPTSR